MDSSLSYPERHPLVITLRATALAAAIALLAACGGNDDDAAPAAPAEDQADAATLAALSSLTSDVDAQLRARGVATVNAPDTPPTDSPAGAPAHGWFPGVAQTNLVANRPEYNAQIVDPDLINPWGIAIRPAGFGGHFWFASAGSGKSIQYVGDVGGVPLFQDELKVIDTLGPSSGTAFNPGSNFVITQEHANGAITAPTKFFFANLSGTVTAWTERPRAGGGFDHPLDSVPVIDGTARHSSFIGVTVAPGAERLLVADFGAEAELRVYNGAFAEQAPMENPFRKAGAQPGGFEAFNVQTLGQSIFAMYGRHVPPGTSPLPAEGRLAEFDAQGRLVAKWAGRGLLNYPWGVAMAPQNYGLYSNCLLVGNFGDGTVVAFHPRYKVAIDYVRDDRGRRVVLDGLWGLQFGNGASLGEANHMYFAAGPNRETDGLVGKLEANPRTLPYIGGISLCH
ncbi:TIGR03118 family protein [Piscinibacter sp. HJYY11]|uniref:TIGR03118 family protein n=1 Tax=Piscinibacter sp. HJYY11 TaxID=2801333 RepID=UPI00191F2DA7|nr:TIGR03118 family protein [Piscinibacter sp. HJYY11]MBL0727284.1 TIGR03118 family protein [Piscinibacter sp. HJYY11]